MAAKCSPGGTGALLSMDPKRFIKAGRSRTMRGRSRKGKIVEKLEKHSSKIIGTSDSGQHSIASTKGGMKGWCGLQYARREGQRGKELGSQEALRGNYGSEHGWAWCGGLHGQLRENSKKSVIAVKLGKK